jgi:hypothetical protein
MPDGSILLCAATPSAALLFGTFREFPPKARQNFVLEREIRFREIAVF